MVTRVLSLVRGADAGSARTADPALDINAFAIADEIELTLVLKDAGIELALADVRHHPVAVAGVEVPAADPSRDLEGLLASGVRVLAVAEDLLARGLTSDALLGGVELIEEIELPALLVAHDVTLTATA